jgi:hypothetical protein
MFDYIKQRLLTETKLMYIDEPMYFKGLVKNPEQIVSWKDIEECINTPVFYDFQIINPDTLIQENIPKSTKIWTDKQIQDKKYIYDKFTQGYSLVITNYGHKSKVTNAFLSMLEEVFETNAQMHIYCGLETAKSFTTHADHPPNFIIQAEGVTPWKVYRNRITQLIRKLPHGINACGATEKDLELVLDVVLEPGDALYIPARVYHSAIPQNKRISISIPCWPDNWENQQLRYDRNYYTL